MRNLLVLYIVGLVGGMALAQRPREGALKVGDPAPDVAAVELNGGKTVKLADQRGKPTVLIFGSCT